MDMGVNQARQDCLSLQVGHFGTGGDRNRSGLDRGDALAFDNERRSVSWLIGDAVNQPGIFEQYSACHN